ETLRPASDGPDSLAAAPGAVRTSPGPPGRALLAAAPYRTCSRPEASPGGAPRARRFPGRLDDRGDDPRRPVETPAHREETGRNDKGAGAGETHSRPSPPHPAQPPRPPCWRLPFLHVDDGVLHDRPIDLPFLIGITDEEAVVTQDVHRPRDAARVV